MAGDNDKDKKGFSGLSGLASEVSGIDEPIKPEPKAEAQPSTSEHQAASTSANDNHRASRPRYPGTSPLTEEQTDGHKRQQPVGSRGWVVFLGIIGLIGVLYWASESSRTSTTGYGSPGKNPSYQSPGYSAASSVPKQPTVLPGRADPLDKRGICELQELLGEMGLYKSTVDK